MMTSIADKDEQDGKKQSMIPIVYNKCATFSGSATFDAYKCPNGGSVMVQGNCVDVGWVFCGTQRDPDYPSFAALLHGDCLQVYGGTFELVSAAEDDPKSWNGETSTGIFTLTHDGTSPEILVIYGTKEKQQR